MATSAATDPVLGYKRMPPDFKYKAVFLKGRPKHRKYDDFWIKHPPMPPSRWAKIFAPFDALEGFDEGIRRKEVQYCVRKELSEGEKAGLDEKLALLCSLAYRSRITGENRPVVSITHFCPCTDIHSEWYGRGGRYHTLTGEAGKFDTVCRTITVGEQIVALDDIVSITVLPQCQAVPVG